MSPQRTSVTNSERLYAGSIDHRHDAAHQPAHATRMPQSHGSGGGIGSLSSRFAPMTSHTAHSAPIVNAAERMNVVPVSAVDARWMQANTRSAERKEACARIGARCCEEVLVVSTSYQSVRHAW